MEESLLEMQNKLAETLSTLFMSMDNTQQRVGGLNNLSKKTLIFDQLSDRFFHNKLCFINLIKLNKVDY